jgi:hypothetical protein
VVPSRYYNQWLKPLLEASQCPHNRLHKLSTQLLLLLHKMHGVSQRTLHLSQLVAQSVSMESQQSKYLLVYLKHQESLIVLSMLAHDHRVSNATSEQTLLNVVGVAG